MFHYDRCVLKKLILFWGKDGWLGLFGIKVDVMRQVERRRSWFNRKIDRTLISIIDKIYGLVGRYYKGYKKIPVFLVGTQR